MLRWTSSAGSISSSPTPAELASVLLGPIDTPDHRASLGLFVGREALRSHWPPLFREIAAQSL
jgi:hypothetical protein